MYKTSVLRSWMATAIRESESANVLTQTCIKICRDQDRNVPERKTLFYGVTVYHMLETCHCIVLEYYELFGGEQQRITLTSLSKSFWIPRRYCGMKL